MRFRPIPFLFLCLGLSACNQDPAKPPVANCTAPPGPSDAAIVTSFNTGLGPGLDVPYATTRAMPIAGALASAAWQVLCLDEVWTDADRDLILARLALPGDQVLTYDTRGRNEDPADRCRPGELDDGLACMRRECAGLRDEDVTACATDKCQAEGLSLNLQHPRCFTCVVAMAGHTADEIESTCEGSGVSRMYGGRNGVILASRVPLRDVEAIELPSSNANRVGLFATARLDQTDVEIACTHLSSAVELIKPSGRPLGAPSDAAPFASWSEEMTTQFDLVSARLNARAQGRMQLMLGDMNSGPKFTGDRKPVTPGLWGDMAAAGFTSTVADTLDPVCSRCPGNTLGPTGDAFLIDHVLMRGREDLQPECAEHLFDAPVRYFDATGAPVTASLSDHYGVSLRLTP